MTVPHPDRLPRDAGAMDATAADAGAAPTDGSGAEASAGFDCPRCHERAVERFYGPCASCRADLRSTLGGVGRDVEREAFQPSMHVTPNAVALKDD